MSRQSETLAILLTDIKEFTSKTSRKSRDDILFMLDKRKELVLPVLEKDGRAWHDLVAGTRVVGTDSP